jgi:hypothetical protein
MLLPREDRDLIRRRVKKFFQGYGNFEGVIDSFDEDTSFYKVVYDDNDSEELTKSEVKKVEFFFLIDKIINLSNNMLINVPNNFSCFCSKVKKSRTRN